MAAPNRVLGRGELHFAPFKPGTQTPTGERYIGNTPSVSLTIGSESLDHYNSDRGINELDDSITVKTDRSAKFVTDDVSAENLALFFFGARSTVTVVGATVTDEAINDVEPGLTYQLGRTATNPLGARNLDQQAAGVNVLVKKAGTTLVEGTAYTIDMARGRLTIIEGGGLIKDDDITVSYKTKSFTRPRVVSGNKPIEGALRYVAYNPKGRDDDFYLPWVQISPDGDFELKAESDWQKMPFNVKILKPNVGEAIYIDGAPAS